MKRLFFFFLFIIFVGAGCASQSNTNSTIGASHFGRVADGSVTESSIKGGWVRPFPGPFWWDEIETSQDVYDWSRADQVVKYWQDRDQAILGTLWPFAQWDESRCHGAEPKIKHPFRDEQVWLMSMCHVESYEEWIRSVAERYDGDGTDDMPGLRYPINHWEIGYQPETQSNEQAFFQYSPIAYEETYRLGYAAIKSAHPNATVLLAGMSSMQPSAYRYWRDFFIANRQWGDLGNIHSAQDAEDFNAKTYRSYLDGLGNESRTFWITRAVVGTPEQEDWTDDEKARMTIVGYTQAFANGAQRIFHGSGQESQFQLVVEMIDGFESVERLNETSVKFEFPKKTVYVLWNEAVLPTDMKGKVEVVRYDRTRQKKKAEEIKADVPMFVIAK